MLLKIVDQKQTNPLEMVFTGYLKKKEWFLRQIVYHSHFAYSLGLMLRYFKVANKWQWTINGEGTLIYIRPLSYFIHWKSAKNKVSAILRAKFGLN